MLAIALCSMALATGCSTADAYRPYDGSGRYTMSQADGALETQDLTALVERHGVKPYDRLVKDGVWQTERVVFRDLETGATIYRLTNDRWMDGISYFHHNWTADGRCLVFRRRPGMWEASTDHAGPMLMNADGAQFRNSFREFRMERNLVCSPTDPGVVYGVGNDKKVVAYDVATGKLINELGTVDRCWHLKISLDGEYLIVKSGKGLETFSTDGQEHYVAPLDGPIHDSYWFHPTLKKILFWYEKDVRTKGFVQADFDGSNAEYSGFLMDWNHGDLGFDRHFHTNGFINRVSGQKWHENEWLTKHDPAREEYDDPHDCNGYLSWMPKDQPWGYASRLPHKPHLAEIQKMHAEPPPLGDVVNRFRICHINTLRGNYWLCNLNASPDGTKVLFNSNFLGANNVYYVVAKKPEPPVGLKAEWLDGKVRLTWSPAKHSKETAGYHVYRSTQSGREYEPMTATPVAETTWTDDAPRPGTAHYYTITAVEHSGLESGLSAEAAAAAQPAIIGDGPVTVFVEAEAGERETPAMWLAFQASASDLHYVWHRKEGDEGRVALSVNVPRLGDYFVWARMKGDGEAVIRVDAPGGSGTLRSAALDWEWLKADQPLRLDAGEQALALTTSVYGTAIDCLWLATDASFVPGGVDQDRCVWPPLSVGDVTARAEGPYSLRLNWQPVDSPTLHHYNVYCARTQDVSPSQSHLVASPASGPHLDWALLPDTTYYYCVTAVDRAGNESAPSLVAEVTTPDVDDLTLIHDVQDAKEIDLTLQLDKPGPYAVWLKMNHKKGGQYVKVGFDDTPLRAWTIQLDGLSDTSWHTYNEFAIYEVEPGSHTLHLSKQSIEHEIVQVVVTNDLSFRPDGHVNMPKGW